MAEAVVSDGRPAFDASRAARIAAMWTFGRRLPLAVVATVPWAVLLDRGSPPQVLFGVVWFVLLLAFATSMAIADVEGRRRRAWRVMRDGIAAVPATAAVVVGMGMLGLVAWYVPLLLISAIREPVRALELPRAVIVVGRTVLRIGPLCALLAAFWPILPAAVAGPAGMPAMAAALTRGRRRKTAALAAVVLVLLANAWALPPVLLVPYATSDTAMATARAFTVALALIYAATLATVSWDALRRPAAPRAAP